MFAGILYRMDTDDTTIFIIGADPYSGSVNISEALDGQTHLARLQFGNPRRLRIYHQISDVSPDHLLSIHAQYAGRRLVGDWFALTGAQRDALVTEWGAADTIESVISKLRDLAVEIHNQANEIHKLRLVLSAM